MEDRFPCSRHLPRTAVIVAYTHAYNNTSHDFASLIFSSSSYVCQYDWWWWYRWFSPPLSPPPFLSRSFCSKRRWSSLPRIFTLQIGFNFVFLDRTSGTRESPSVSLPRKVFENFKRLNVNPFFSSFLFSRVRVEHTDIVRDQNETFARRFLLNIQSV